MSQEESASNGVETARALVDRLFAAALDAVNPTLAVRRALRLQDETLIVGDRSIEVAAGIFVVGIGKAAIAMTHGALEALGTSSIVGHVITKEGHAGAVLPETIAVHEAGHPIPDERGVHATRLLLDALAKLGRDETVVALISGGGSALLEAPIDGVSLEDLALTTDLLLRAGAPIDALNAVRAPLSRVKAGGLRAAAPMATWVTLILSDVLGNDPRVIASGPTVPNRPDLASARSIVETFGVRDRLPSSIIAALDEERDAPVLGDERDVLLVIGDNAAAVEAAAAECARAGLDASIVWTAMEGEAAALGRTFVDQASAAPEAVDVLLGGGEATVTVRGAGRGGRNTEFALAAALELERRGMDGWVVASLGTDGQDAMTGLAGAVVDGRTCELARDAGIDPAAALARNDSAVVFEEAGGALSTGPTGTNVNDLYFAVRVTDSKTASIEGGG